MSALWGEAWTLRATRLQSVKAVIAGETAMTSPPDPRLLVPAPARQREKDDVCPVGWLIEYDFHGIECSEVVQHEPDYDKWIGYRKETKHGIDNWRTTPLYRSQEPRVGAPGDPAHGASIEATIPRAASTGDTLCGCGYRRSLHQISADEGGVYCLIARLRHALTALPLPAPSTETKDITSRKIEDIER